MFHRPPCIAAGVGGRAGIAGHLLNGRFQLTQRVADLPGVAGLALGAVVQGGAHAGQGVAAASHLLGVVADGADQLHQVLAQAVERFLDVVQLAVGLAQADGGGEVALGPVRQGRGQAGQGARQAPLQGVDEQGDQQDQADHQALADTHFGGNVGVLATDFRLQPGDGLLHRVEALASAGGQGGAALDLLAGALQFGRVAIEQALQFALQAHGDVFLLLAGLGLKAHHGGEIVGIGLGRTGNAQQRQAVEGLSLGADQLQLALHFVGQFRAAAADQLVAGQRQAPQVHAGIKQGHQVTVGLGTAAVAGVAGQLFEVGPQFALGLQQQCLRVAGQLAGRQQFFGGKGLQAVEAGAQFVGQRVGPFGQCRLQLLVGLHGGGMAQGITAGQIGLNVARRLVLELLGQAQVALHHLIGALQGTL
ncbi:hypothetical protein D3C81_1175700 [compost metagenome]